MELTVTVTSVKFTDELKNHSSQEFREFNKTFTEQVSLGEQGPMATQFPPEQSLQGKKAAGGCSLVRCAGVPSGPHVLRACQWKGEEMRPGFTRGLQEAPEAGQVSGKKPLHLMSVL